MSTQKTSMKPLVSFVVPCYNLGHLLPFCIKSILAQDYENIEGDLDHG